MLRLHSGSPNSPFSHNMSDKHGLRFAAGARGAESYYPEDKS